MDSLRKRPQAPINKPLPRPQTPRIPQRPLHARKDVLYISKQESLEMDKFDKHESKFQKGLYLRKLIFRLCLGIFILLISLLTYFLVKSFIISRKMNADISRPATFAQNMRSLISPIAPVQHKQLNSEGDRINILLLGAAGEHKPGGNLTDTIMVMSVNTKSQKVALLSLPRDFYAPVPDSKTFTKINSLYPIGIKDGRDADYIKQTVEKITGLPMNYYVVLDFDGFEKIIDDIGGVNINNERDIYDPRYPGPNYSYQTFQLSKGFHNLDGKTALQYVRERHDDPEGDFGRAKRQQQVIQATKNKMFSLQTFFNLAALSNVLDTLGDNIKTNITFEDIDAMIELSKKVDLQNINNVVVDAWKPDSLLKVSHVQVGDARAFILVPRVGNYSEIQDLAQNIFQQDQLKIRSEQIQNEQARVEIVNQSGDSNLPAKIKDLLTDKLGIKNVQLVPTKEKETVDKTSVIDNSQGDKIYTIDELIKKLPASLASPEARVDDKGDITIILGSDLIENYKFEQDSIDEYNQKQGEQESIDFIN